MQPRADDMPSPRIAHLHLSPATPRTRDASSLPLLEGSDDRLIATVLVVTVLVVRLPPAAAVAGRGIG